MIENKTSADGVYHAHEVEKGILAIEEGGVRCFLIDGGEKTLLIDTGFGKGDLAAFVSTLTKGEVTLVNTHADGDHTGCNRQFSCCYMHPAEFDRYLYGKEQSCPPKALWEGERLRFGEYDFEVLLIPGHTPGSIALWDEKQGVLISGDSVQSGAVFMFGQGRNLPAFIESMEKLQGIQEKVRVVLPSHGECRVAPETISNMLVCAKKLQAGELDPTEPERPVPAKQYSDGRAAFLYGK